MKTIKYAVAGVLTAVLFLSAILNVSTVHATEYPPCPITPQAGRIIVNFPVGSPGNFAYEYTERIVSDVVNNPQYSFKTPSVSTSIPAGNYKVTIFGGDSGIDRASLIPEPNEKFFIILNNGGTEVARTNSTDDVPDGVNMVGVQKVVNTNLSVGQNVDSILAYHSNYPDTSSANSVVPICAAFDVIVPVVVNPTLTLIKTVINDNGGTKTVADFPLFIGSTPVASGATTSVAAGTYLVSETNSAGYTASGWGGDCAANGSITLAAGENKTCTITNNDNAPAIVGVNPKLTLIKTVINDNGGTKTVADFPLFIGSTSVVSGVSTTLAAGTYTVSETNSAGYTAGSWGGDCAANGTITLALGDIKTCTITNNDNAPTVVGVTNPRLTVVKTVINDNGGTKNVSDFPLFVGSTSVTSGVATTFSSGTYTVSETNTAGYTAGSWGGDCTANGTITLAAGDNKTCTITNNDNAPEVENRSSGGRRARTVVVLDSHVPPPVIDVVKIPTPSSLLVGGGVVNYSYTVTNPGTFALSNVIAVDDKCAPLNFISGDTNGDSKLDVNEAWHYACQSYLMQTTTNTVTVEGTANGITARDFAIATVVVGVPGFPETGYGSGISDKMMAMIMFSSSLLLPVFLYVLAKRKTV